MLESRTEAPKEDCKGIREEMKQFEHAVTKSLNAVEEIHMHLNASSDEGWELVSSHSYIAGDYVYFIWKRPVPAKRQVGRRGYPT